MKKPLILVTNDDGITSPGIRALIECVSEFGTPFIVAPDSPQSGQGHAITLTEPVRLKAVDLFEGITAYECSGTPADCVKLAKNVLLKDKTIDLCVSGINHGSNASINIIYSGTMSAAREASIEGITAIGFSHEDYSHSADMEECKIYTRRIIEATLNKGLGKAKLLNVNFPRMESGKIKGMKVCKQGKGNWNEKYQENKDPRDKPYYWLAGDFTVQAQEEDSDLHALANGYVSIVPAINDLTDYAALGDLNFLENETSTT